MKLKCTIDPGVIVARTTMLVLSSESNYKDSALT